MKKITGILAVVALSSLLVGSVFAQNTANQSVTVSVSAITKIGVSGNPGALTISAGTEGTDALTPVTDGTTTYSITHNSASNLRITAALNSAIGAGYSLEVSLNSGNGSSAGYQVLGTSSVDVVTGIARGGDAAKTISYRFSANASAGELASTTKTVTFTLTN